MFLLSVHNELFVGAGDLYVHELRLEDVVRHGDGVGGGRHGAGAPGLLLGVRQNVRFQVGGLSEFLVAALKRADVWSVSCVDPDVCSEVEVEGKPLATPLKRTLKWFFSCVYKLMSL